MSSILTLFILLGGSSKQEYIQVCARDFNHLKDSTKIELYIGCSTIRGRQAYRESVLSDIYEVDRAIFLTK